MKKLLFFCLIALSLSSNAQTLQFGDWYFRGRVGVNKPTNNLHPQAVFEVGDSATGTLLRVYKDGTVQSFKLKNNAAGDSILTLDQYGKFKMVLKAGPLAWDSITGKPAVLISGNNLADVSNVATARENLSVYPISVVNDSLLNHYTKGQADGRFKGIGWVPGISDVTGLPDTLTAVQGRIQTKQPLLGFTAVPDTRTVNGHALSADISVTKSDVGLSNVPNTDATNAANITQTSSYRFVSDSEKSTWNAKQDALGYTAENVGNKATDFSVVNNTLYPTVQAVSNFTQSALTGVLKDRGNYDASSNLFPSSGGSGSGGAIKTGDMWYINVGGTLGGIAVSTGSWVRALVDAPGQTSGNWAIASGAFGYVPENSANKSTSTSLGTSNTLYPSQNAVKSYVDAAVANGNTAYSWGNWAANSHYIGTTLIANNRGSGSQTLTGVSIDGNAATATTAANTTAISGITSNLSSAVQSGTVSSILGQDVNNNLYRYNASAVQTFLGLGSYAYRSSGLAELSGSDFTGTLSNSGIAAWTSGIRYFLSVDAGTARFRYNTLSDLQTYLGLGSYAYRSSGLAELSGATFTGAILGTTANFSGSGTFEGGVYSKDIVSVNAATYPSTYPTSIGANSGAGGYVQLGNNSDNYIVGGSTATGGNLRFYVNNTSILPAAPNGTLALTIASNATITAASSVTATAFYESSDLRQKMVHTTLKSSDGIDAIQYTFKPSNTDKWGYSAQQVRTILPYAVSEASDGFLKVDYTTVHTYKIAQLEKRIAELEKLVKK